ncbi:MAG: Co2+/Mg2+ efflux protein ApaG [Bacteroidota bacterium]
METSVTNNIRVSVIARYQTAYSKPTQDQYVFSYHVVIENCGQHTVQLLRRHWIITNSLGIVQEVEGEGVIGQQPVLEPGDIHKYDSWCPLTSPFGIMEGSYSFINHDTGESFEAEVPRFRLESSAVLN